MVIFDTEFHFNFTIANSKDNSMRNLYKLLMVQCCFLLIPSFYLFAQVGINDGSSMPASSAMLDVQSTTKGMLMPRMTSALRAAIVNPVNGLMVYQTDAVSGVYYYNGTVWQRIGETDGSETKVTAGANVTVTGTGTTVSPYVINAGGGGSSGHYVGELFGGGIIFWVDNSGQHGYIVSLINLSTTAQWSNLYITTGAVSTWNGDGNSATIAGISPAASLCLNYTNSNYGTGTFSDWYLPALDQLSVIYHNRLILNKNIESVAGSNNIANSFYWSSTEDTNYSAWSFDCYSGSAADATKNYYYSVRAVRTF
jgi:hypothetical protein